MRLASWFLVSSVLLATSSAQKILQPGIAATGTVSGHVVCSDTQRPARFADVYLVPKPDVSPSSKAKSTTSSVLYLIHSTTTLDGSFTVARVPPGEYYVVPRLAGYVVPIASAKPKTNADNTGYADVGEVLANFSVADVIADRSVELNLSLTRGAVVSGHLLFDDGGPVVRQWVRLTPASGEDPFEANVGLGLSDLTVWERNMQTDDEGHFRFAGIPPGKYLVVATVESATDQRVTGTLESAHYGGYAHGDWLRVYAPGVFRRADAKEIEVKGAETQMNDDIDVDLGKVHAVRGRLISAVDQHPLSFGFVSLKDAADPQAFSTGGIVEPDGTYHLGFVPEGTYTLEITRAADLASGTSAEDQRFVATYADGKLPVIVDDKDVEIPDIALAVKSPAGKVTDGAEK
jgi:hypothetical protein